MASEGLHEAAERLSEATIDAHRGYQSVIEELEAADWYNQRIDATSDEELARVLTHSRDEEKEHAAMTLEWLRRHDSALDAQLRKYLFTDQPLPLPEGDAGGGDAAGVTESSGPDHAGTLGIGSLRGAEMMGGI